MPLPRRHLPFLSAAATASLLFMLNVPAARGAEITPFNTFDQSPLVQIYGLPAPGSARILARGENEAGIAVDLASNYAGSAAPPEAMILDGETLRSTISFSRGFGTRYQAGIELPVVSQSGGFTDGFIEGWHRFFHLPDGGRPHAPKDRLLYLYLQNGEERMRFTRSGAGIGDLRLTGGAQLFRGERGAVAVRTALKLPTGDSASLQGSGSTDCSLWVTAQGDSAPTSVGRGAVFASLGAMVKSRGDVLPGQQRYLIGFGSLGAGWSPTERLAFKLQLSSHTPFYRGSDLPEINAFSTLLLVGGTVAFTRRTALDIAVSEDVAVYRSPDVSLHLALSTKF